MKGGLRAGIIGLGVGERHIAGYESDPRCRVVALCDIDPAKLAEVGARHPGRRQTSDPAEILGDPAIDAVSICSWDDAHHAQVMAALAVGKHVFVEKPLCLFRHELDDIAGALAARPDLHLSSNLILRRTPRFVTLRDRVRAGELGRLYYLEGDYNYGRLEKITTGWRGRLPFYSVMHGGGIHLIDLLLWIAGELPVEAMAYGTGIASEGTAFRHDDTVVALLKFESGMIAKIAANFGCVVPHFHNLALYGTSGTFAQTPQGAAIWRSRDPARPPETVDEPYPGAAKGDLLPSFVAAILDGGLPEVTAGDVLAGMAVSLAIEEARASGAPAAIRYARTGRA